MGRTGIVKELKLREHYEKRSEKKKRKSKAAVQLEHKRLKNKRQQDRGIQSKQEKKIASSIVTPSPRSR
jgi:hypothetical protein